jgi:hypothetical protein
MVKMDETSLFNVKIIYYLYLLVNVWGFENMQLGKVNIWWFEIM